MILKLSESKLFTVDPALRFADAYKVAPYIFNDLWRRYKLLGYTISELCEWYYIKVGAPIRHAKMERWLFREQVYLRAQEALKKGAQAVNSDFFGDLEQELLQELFKNLKSGVTIELKILA